MHNPPPSYNTIYHIVQQLMKTHSSILLMLLLTAGVLAINWDQFAGQEGDEVLYGAGAFQTFGEGDEYEEWEVQWGEETWQENIPLWEDSIFTCHIENTNGKVKAVLTSAEPVTLTVNFNDANGYTYDFQTNFENKLNHVYSRLCAGQFQILMGSESYGFKTITLRFDNLRDLVLSRSISSQQIEPDQQTPYLSYFYTFLYNASIILTFIVVFYAVCYFVYLFYCHLGRWAKPQPTKLETQSGSEGVVASASKDINQFSCKQASIVKNNNWDWSRVYLNKNPIAQPLKLKVKHLGKWPINVGIAFASLNKDKKLEHTTCSIYGSNSTFYNGTQTKLGKGLGFKSGDILVVTIDEQNNFVKWQVQGQVIYGAYVDFTSQEWKKDGEWRYVLEMRDKGDQVIVME